MLHLWRGICYASNESEIKIKCPISPYLYQCSVSVFLITYCPVLSRWHLDTFQQFLLMVLRTHIKHSPSSLLSSTAQHTAPLLGSVEMLKGFWVLSEQLLDHRGDVVCNISTRPYPWLPGKIIKSMMTEKKECITPRSCLTKPLNICTKERWK